jgi:hypothetical protein
MEKLKSVKVDARIMERVKDLKKYLRLREKLSVTEAEILSQAFEMAFEHQEELVKRLKKRRNSEFWEFWMTPVEGGPVTDAAKDHDQL